MGQEQAQVTDLTPDDFKHFVTRNATLDDFPEVMKICANNFDGFEYMPYFYKYFVGDKTRETLAFVFKNKLVRKFKISLIITFSAIVMQSHDWPVVSGG